MHLAATTHRDLPDTDLAVIPVGSTEQHGPHAPYDTDTQIATHLAAGGVTRADTDVLVTPPVPVGVASEHRHFPGSLWVSPDTFKAYLRDLCAALVVHDYTTIVFVNGHGGNTPALTTLSQTLSHDDATATHAVTYTWFDAVPETVDALPASDALPADLPPLGHGGALETSLLEFLAPHRVKPGRYAAAGDDAADTWGTWVSHTNLATATDEFAPNGVVGDPRDASPLLGEALYRYLTGDLATLLDTLAEQDK